MASESLLANVLLTCSKIVECQALVLVRIHLLEPCLILCFLLLRVHLLLVHNVHKVALIDRLRLALFLGSSQSFEDFLLLSSSLLSFPLLFP